MKHTKNILSALSLVFLLFTQAHTAQADQMSDAASLSPQEIDEILNKALSKALQSGQWNSGTNNISSLALATYAKHQTDQIEPNEILSSALKGQWSLVEADISGSAKLHCVSNSNEAGENDALSLKLSQKGRFLKIKFSMVCDALNLNEQTLTYSLNSQGDVLSGGKKVGDLSDSWIVIKDPEASLVKEIQISLIEKEGQAAQLSFDVTLSVEGEKYKITSILKKDK